jgi:hypothetical protein
MATDPPLAEFGWQWARYGPAGCGSAGHGTNDGGAAFGLPLSRFRRRLYCRAFRFASM